MAKGIRKEYRKQRQLMHEDYLKNELTNDRFSDEEKKILFDLMSSMKYGVNRIKEVLNNLLEISKREGTSVRTVIEELEIDNIIKGAISGTKAKAEYVRNVVRKKRYPKITKFEEEWKSKIKELKLPKGLSIEPPRNFEGDRLLIRIQMKNLGEYKTYLKKLDDIQEGLKGLLELL